jgi:hypothetical protein
MPSNPTHRSQHVPRPGPGAGLFPGRAPERCAGAPERDWASWPMSRVHSPDFQ